MCSWAIAAETPPCTLPTAPTDLSVVAGDSENTLSFPAGVGATGYNIKRSLVPGGPYTVIDMAMFSPYLDGTVDNGTTYYYVVSSTNACGESTGNSPESHGTPSAVIILPDGVGFWRVILDVSGLIGMQSDPGPATPDVILADGGGGFFKLVADPSGTMGTQTDPGPATVAPIILDANLVAWTLVVDATGNVGATS